MTPLRSALKPTATQYHRLPPPEQFQHSDPLLRRLRLVDAQGKPVSLTEHFGPRVKCVGFYFSSEWAGQPLKQYDQAIARFSQEHAEEFKVVYVSVDVDEAWYKAGMRGTPWVSMVWGDGSDSTDKTTPDSGARRMYSNATAGFPDDRATPSVDATPSSSLGDSGRKLAQQVNGTGTAPDNRIPSFSSPSCDTPGEDFLRSGEVDIDASLARTDTSGQAYLRPFSRVHLAIKLNVTAAPTLVIYHLPSRRLIERSVPISRLRPGAPEQATWAQWQLGQSSSPWDTLAGTWPHKVPALLSQFPWGIALVAIVLFYWLGNHTSH